MLKVAIAEDDFRIADIHEKFLAKISGTTVVGKALNAEQTLRLLENKAVDLLLLDVYMPDRLGTELLHIVRERFPAVDIIMVTAATDKTMVDKSLKYGVVDYIVKPVSMDRFILTIDRYINRKKVLTSHKEMTQEAIDKLLGFSIRSDNDHTSLPKGIDPLTLRKVKQTMKTVQRAISAEEMGEMMGASRTTARRYLEYLTSIGEGEVEQEYGEVGRPERKYKILMNQS